MTEGYPSVSLSLETGGILVSQNHVYCKLGNNTIRDLTQDTIYTHPSSKQCNYTYTHPATKQCNYSPDLSECLQGTAFTYNIRANYQAITFNRVESVYVTLNNDPGFGQDETFYISNSSPCVVNVNIPTDIRWTGGLSLFFEVYVGYYNDYLAFGYVQVFNRSNWTAGTYTWQIPGEDLIVPLSESIRQDAGRQLYCRFRASDRAGANSPFYVTSLSWQISGARFSV